MEVKVKKLDELNPAPYNPRKELKKGDPTYEKLKASMDRFGYVEPIVWNVRTGNIIGGHQRFQVLLDEGKKETEVVVVNLAEDEEKALNLALNKIQGEWDFQKLGVLLRDIPVKMQPFTGFDPHEVVILTQDRPITMSDMVQSDDIPDSAKCGGRQDSFIIYLSFSTFDAAQGWLSKNHPGIEFRKNKKTCVVDMG